MYQTSEDYFLNKLDSERRTIVDKVLDAIDAMDYSSAEILLKPYLDQADPFALYYAASFSRPSESVEDFEKRHISQIQLASDKGYPPAIHKLAVCYDAGDFVSCDEEKAANLFEIAAKKGHPHSQWIHGNDLLYGNNGVPKNIELGLSFIEKSFSAKFEGAMASISEFYREGKYGYPLDLEKSQAILDDIEKGEILSY